MGTAPADANTGDERREGRVRGWHNMDCAACPLIVKRRLAKIPGVPEAVVSYPRRTASVTFDDAAAAAVPALIEAITRAGYPSRLRE